MSSSDRVLLVANYESDVGYAWWLMENFWQLIASSVAARGGECILAYPRIGVVPELIQRSPVTILEFPFRHDSLGDIRRGLSFIRKHRIRSIYLTDWPYLHWVYLLWRLAGVRRIVMHDHTPGDRPALAGWQARIKNLLHRAGACSATLYVGVSDYIGERLERNALVPATRITVVTNGIAPLEQRSGQRAEVRRRLAIPEHAVMIVMVSRATYYKGLDFAVRCFAELLREGALRRCIYAVHCGDGPDLQAFVQLAHDLGVAGNVTFLGRRSDVREILFASDIAFHPSHGEAMSLSILEFMSAGLAVVTSDLPSVCTAIRAGIDGLTYKYGDTDAAVDTLRRLVEQPQLRQTLGSAAAESSRRKYTLAAMNSAFAARVLPRL